MSRGIPAVQQRVYDVLAAAALRGTPCPSNIEIADLVTMEPGDVSNALSGLVTRGMIEVHRGRPRNRRSVTIVASGTRTGETVLGRAQQARPGVDAEPTGPLPPSVHRDPCPRCGVRGDLDCAHGWQP